MLHCDGLNKSNFIIFLFFQIYVDQDRVLYLSETQFEALAIKQGMNCLARTRRVGPLMKYIYPYLRVGGGYNDP